MASRDQGAGPLVEPIAIIGMACRVPGAGDTGQFWRNLTDGVESVRFYTREEQAALGVTEAELNDPNFVPAGLSIEDYDRFDAELFGMTRREAELSDPQQRLFLELANTALEDAGHDPAAFDGQVGVYGGTGTDEYLWNHLRPNRRLLAAAGMMSLAVGNHPDYVATLVSYKLNLRGPSLTVHTACSTSMVAVHLAAEALRSGECDLALAGGVCLDLPLGRGYVYQEGGITSPDGHCRPFDSRAAGTLWGAGGGVVVLRRLADALADGDDVRAVLLADGVNNDGSAKVGFTAPGVDGQAELIAQVLELAQVDARTVSYVEAHGTGTALGDPIEVAALTRVYRGYGDENGWCAIGSVKSNIGHLSQAAGVAALIKTVLALRHGIIPPSINFERPNPSIDFDSSPFYVNAALATWQGGGTPRRAAVSCFGIGGTNAHVLLEEAPRRSAPDGPARPAHLIQVSAHTRPALDEAAARLADHFGADPATDLADAAYTLRAGRVARRYRTFVVADTPAAAAKALRAGAKLPVREAGEAPRTALLFSGQGAQYAGMAEQLYRYEPEFAARVDECLSLLAGEPDDLSGRLRGALLAPPDGRAAADDEVRRTELAQPALFIVGYALAGLWSSWGIEPDAMIGHSIGEYVAATLSGVFDLADALGLVALRGRLMQSLPAGAMLSVALAEPELDKILPDGLSVAAVNGPAACVVSGPTPLIDEFAQRLGGDGVSRRKLRTSHAFHSPMMAPILAEFRDAVARVAPGAPRRAFLSNVTGDWAGAEQTTDPSYWARQLREPVRFDDCVSRLLAGGGWTLLECGPGRQLAGLARMRAGRANAVLHSLPGGGERTGALETVYAAAGALWSVGAPLSRHACGGKRRRVALPTYPYQRKRYWIEAASRQGLRSPEESEPQQPRGPLPVDEWCSVPSWRQLPPLPAQRRTFDRCLLLGVRGPAAELGRRLRGAGVDVVEVAEDDPRCADREGFEGLLAALRADGGVPDRVIFAWPLADDAAGGDVPAAARDGVPAGPTGDERGGVERALDRGFYRLLALTQALIPVAGEAPVRLDVLTAGALGVVGGDLAAPGYAAVTGVARVAPLEVRGLAVHHIDVPAGDPAAFPAAAVVAELFAGAAVTGEPVALRGARRWALEHVPVALPAADGAGLRARGVYVITGGLGGVGLSIAQDLAARLQARLVLLGRGGLPAEQLWDDPPPDGFDGRTARAIAAVRGMRRAGAEVVVLAADVTDAAAMRVVRERVVQEFGRVDGIVHAAGVAGGGMVEVKDRPTAERVLAPKVYGTLALRAAFGDLDLDFVALCSSITGVVGGLGQVDYCAANAFLDAYAQSGRWPARVVSLDWGGWLEVGMAVETEAPQALRAAGRVEPAAGARGIPVPIDHPVLTVGYHGGADAPTVAEGRIGAQTHWILDEHRIDGVPVMPGTGQLETVRAAFAALVPAPDPAAEVQLRDVLFLQPLAVPDGHVATVRVSLEETGDGHAFVLESVADAGPVVHTRGTALWVRPAGIRPLDVPAVLARCAPVTGGSGRQSMVIFGPRFAGLAEAYANPEEEIARLVAPPLVAGELERWALHPALLDEATSFLHSRGNGTYLPLGYGSLTVHRPLPATFLSHLRYHPSVTDEVIGGDLSLVAEDGQALVTIADFVMRRVDPTAVGRGLNRGQPASTGSGPQRGAPPPAASPEDGSPAGSAPAVGIRPADGAEAFRRLVAADLGAQVVVSAIPLPRVVAAVRGLTTATVEDQLDPASLAGRRSREEPDDEFVAPATATEEALARIWSDVLGADRVGGGDDFFDLGGNSLVAVQVIAQIRARLGVRLPMRAIFESPTVTGMAALVDEMVAGEPRRPPSDAADHERAAAPREPVAAGIVTGAAAPAATGGIAILPRNS